jgi:hypothetical protein
MAGDEQMTLPHSHELDGQILLYSEEGVVVCFIGAYTVVEAREAFEAWMNYRNMMMRKYTVPTVEFEQARRRWHQIRDMLANRPPLVDKDAG